MKEAAEMYALGCIGKEDVEYLVRKELGISISFDKLPKEFFDYVEQYSDSYDDYLKKRKINNL